MFCPNCGDEFIAEITQCPDCDIALEEEKGEEPHPLNAWVAVLETADVPALSLARSLLQAAEIPYRVKSDTIQDIFGIGRVVYNPAVSMPVVMVPQSHGESAAELLAELRN